MSVGLERIEVEAFRCFAGASALDVGALPAGLHLVRGRNLANAQLGSNGAGKSTFFADAPTWCLYGRTVGGLRTTDVQSWLVEARPRVAVTLRVGGVERVVQRGPRASDLAIDGRAVAQADVDALVGLDFAAWSQAVVWGQGQPLFLDLAPAAKAELLSTALGLERWERRAEAAAARARRLEDRLRTTEGEVVGLEAAAEHAEAAFRAARDASGAWGQERARRVEEAARTAREARERAVRVEGLRGEADLAAEAAGLRARALREDAAPLHDEHDETSASLREADARLVELRKDLEIVRGQLPTKSGPAKCPTCGQSISRAKLEAHARPLRERATKLEGELLEAEAARAVALGAYEDVRARAAEAALAQRDADIALGAAEAELRGLSRTLGEALAEAEARERGAREVASEENPHRAAERDARARLRDVGQRIAEARGLAERLEASAERARFWAKGFREIRLGVVDDVLSELRESTADVLDRLGMGEWSVEYATERETKSGTTQRALAVTVRSPTSPDGVRWEVYSGGERQRLRLAAAAALSEVLLARAGASIDYRVLDEPTRGLSAEGVGDLVEVLGEYAAASGLKAFFVDHLAVDSDRFASTVVVVSSFGGSTTRRD